MSADIYVLENDGNSKILDKIQCKDETKELQDLLEKNLQMIPGKQINPEDPLRWMLIKREMPVPDPETGGNRWSIDFVLVDHLARPAFVECKRFQDTRSRREVIGQMFEYAANGSFYWEKNHLKGFAEESAKNIGVTLEDELNALFEGETRDVDEFFQQVTDNLEAGQMRLIFFMEEAPYQLKSMVEFLNKQMESTDVLLVEATQYEHEGKRFVSPMLFGYTEEARRVKKIVTIQKGESRQWDEDSFFEAVKINLKGGEYQAIRTLYDQCKNMGFELTWGIGKEPCFYPAFDNEGQNKPIKLFGVFVEKSTGKTKIDINFANLSKLGIEYSTICAALKKIGGINLPEEKRASKQIDFSLVSESRQLDRFLHIFVEMIQTKVKTK